MIDLKSDGLNTFNRLVLILVSIAVFSIILLLTLYMYNFMATGSADQGAFAQFGDYIGGVLNPIFGFLTIVLLIYSIRVQAQELRIANEELGLAREEMKISNKEARKSSEAMMMQFALMEKRDKIKEDEILLLTYKNKLQQYKSKTWFVNQNNMLPLRAPSGIPSSITYQKLMNGWAAMRNEHNEYYLKYFGNLRYVTGDSEYGGFVEQIQSTYFKISECIGSLIVNGARYRTCELEVHRFFDEIRYAQDVGLLSDNELKPLYNEIQQANAQRKGLDVNFPEFRQEIREVAL